MDTQQHKYAQMQDKLKNGLANLKNISPDDSTGVGTVLLQLHGALEDYVRLAMGDKVPGLRDVLKEKGKVKWPELLAYGRTYLGFSDADCDTIAEANRQRNSFAHGGTHSYSYEQLRSYARFVQGWCEGTGIKAAKESVQERKVETHFPAPEPAREARYENSPAKPWYRSTVFLVFAFFFLSPIWAILMVTDREQNFLVRSFASVILVSFCFLAIGLVAYGGTLAGILEQALETDSDPFTPPAISSPSAVESPGLVPATEPALPPAPATPRICTVVWVEYTDGDLGKKTRSMVWEQIVSGRVQGSGMTPREFYDLVAEQNPELVADGYEFKSGKTYVLPECQ